MMFGHFPTSLDYFCTLRLGIMGCYGYSIQRSLLLHVHRVSTYQLAYSLINISHCDIMTEEFLYLERNQHKNGTNHPCSNDGLPAQHGILATLGSAIFHIRPPSQELLMQHYPRQLARDSTVKIFDDGKVGGKEDVKVALLDLKCVRTAFPRMCSRVCCSHMAC